MRVLFIGNSHTYVNDMPQIFAEICRKAGVATEVTMLTHGGMGWDFHEVQPEVRFNIRYGNYDAVVLQHTAHPMGDLDVMHESGSHLIEWVKEANAKPILYMTWTAKRDGAAAQPGMSEPYRRLAREYGCAIAPVGEAWWRFHAVCPDAELYAPDGEHASLTGSTLAAYTVASVILDRPAADLTKTENETAQSIGKAIDAARCAEKELL